MRKRWVFDGHIAGIGTESGLRAVVGLWQQSPFGPFADAMVELPSGHRILLAPTAEVGDFIAEVYNFDETRVVDVAASRSGHELRVDAGPLRIRAAVGARTSLGALPGWSPGRWPCIRGGCGPSARSQPGSARGPHRGRREGRAAGVLRRHRPAPHRLGERRLGRRRRRAPGSHPARRHVRLQQRPPEPSLARVRTTVLQAGAGKRS